MIGSLILAYTLAQAPAPAPAAGTPGQPPAMPAPPAAPPGVSPAAPQWPKTIAGRTLADCLKDLSGNNPDGAIREYAIKLIPLFGPDAREPALKPLIRVAREDSDPGVRVNAILALGMIGASNKDEAKQIIEALKLAINNAALGSVIRLHATKAIANYGNFPEQANDAIATITGISKDPSWETRKSVAFTLGQIGGPVKTKVEPKMPLPTGARPPDIDPKTGPNQAAMKSLLGMLNDQSAAVRLQAVESLTLLGPPAVSPENYSAVVTPYMTAIAERTKSEKDKCILIWLQMLTMRLDGNQFNDATMTKIVEYAKGPEIEPQLEALQSLSLLGEKSLTVGYPFAASLLKSTEPSVVVASAQYLATMGVAAKQALPDLEQAKSVAKDETLKTLLGNTIDILNGKKPAEKK